MTIELFFTTILPSALAGALISSLTALFIDKRNRKFEENKELRKVNLYRYEGIHKGFEELIEIKEVVCNTYLNKDNEMSGDAHKYSADMKDRHSVLVKIYERIASLMDVEVQKECDYLIEKEVKKANELFELSVNSNANNNEIVTLYAELIVLRRETFKTIKEKVREQLNKLVNQI